MNLYVIGDFQYRRDSFGVWEKRLKDEQTKGWEYLSGDETDLLNEIHFLSNQSDDQKGAEDEG